MKKKSGRNFSQNHALKAGTLYVQVCRMIDKAFKWNPKKKLSDFFLVKHNFKSDKHAGKKFKKFFFTQE